MMDTGRIQELRDEIGEEDMILVFGIFLSEAERMIARIATGLGDVDHAKAAHFLRSGALNLGLVSLAAAADGVAAVDAADRAASARNLSTVLAASLAALDLPLPQD